MFARTDKQGLTAATQKVLALFVAVWVSLALQPCAMAAASDDSCPHCPTKAEASPAPKHHDCDTASDGSADLSAICASAQSSCCDVDEGITSVRVESPDFDDDTTVLPMSAPAALICSDPCEESGHAADPPDNSGGSVPLYVLKCVYLK